MRPFNILPSGFVTYLMNTANTIHCCEVELISELQMPICLTVFLSNKAISVGVISAIATAAVTKRSILTTSTQ